MHSFWQWLYDLPLSGQVRDVWWIYGVLECIHLYSMVVLTSALVAIDLRLLGVTLGKGPRRPLSEFARRALTWVIVAFIINAITGSILFASNAPDFYVKNVPYLIKMALIFVAVIYHGVIFSVVAKWDGPTAIPTMGTRFVGAFSILLWIGVIAASRWIAFV